MNALLYVCKQSVSRMEKGSVKALNESCVLWINVRQIGLFVICLYSNGRENRFMVSNTSWVMQKNL